MKKFLFIGLLLSFIFVAAIATLHLQVRATVAQTRLNVALNVALTAPVAIVAQKTDSEMTPNRSSDSTAPASESFKSQENAPEQQQTSAKQNADQSASQQNTDAESSGGANGGPYDIQAIEEAYRSLYGS